MRNVFTRSLISTASASEQKKRVMEAIYILLALTLMGLGIAGFLTLFKKISLEPTTTTTTTSNKSLLSYVFPSLQLSCAPLFENLPTTKKNTVLWNGICRPIGVSSHLTFRLTLTSKESKRKFHGFKLAKEILYIFNPNSLEQLSAGEYSAAGFSTYAIGGATFLRVKSIKNNAKLNIIGFGLGFGILVDKKMSLSLTEIPVRLSAEI